MLSPWHYLSVMPEKPLHIVVNLAKQRLYLYTDEMLVAEYPVSTASRGAGEQMNSFCTPRGRHRIRAKIGEQAPSNAVFRGRRFTGEVYSADLAAEFPDRDWILTRILWLGGLEPGRNRYGNVDSQRRYIYIHGTPDSEPMGVPASIGCIRMRNDDLLDLFERVPVNTTVFIQE